MAEWGENELGVTHDFRCRPGCHSPRLWEAWVPRGLEEEWGVTSGHTQVSADPGGDGHLVLSGQGLPRATMPGRD